MALLLIHSLKTLMCLQIFIHAFRHFPWPGRWGQWPWLFCWPHLVHGHNLHPWNLIYNQQKLLYLSGWSWFQFSIPGAVIGTRGTYALWELWSTLVARMPNLICDRHSWHLCPMGAVISIAIAAICAVIVVAFNTPISIVKFIQLCRFVTKLLILLKFVFFPNSCTDLCCRSNSPPHGKRQLLKFLTVFELGKEGYWSLIESEWNNFFILNYPTFLSTPFDFSLGKICYNIQFSFDHILVNWNRPNLYINQVFIEGSY